MHLHLTIYQDLFAYIKLPNHLELCIDLLHTPLPHKKDLVEVDVNVLKVMAGYFEPAVSLNTFL